MDGVQDSGAFYAAQRVLPALVEAGCGTIVLAGAGAIEAREFGSQGVHVAHVVIDCRSNTPTMRAMSPEREENTMLSPDAAAVANRHLHTQDPAAWRLGLDPRPSVESF